MGAFTRCSGRRAGTKLKQRPYHCFQLGFLKPAGMATAHFPLPVHHQSERQDPHTIAGLAHQGHCIEAAYQKRIVDAELAGKLAYFFRLIKSDAYELKTSPAITVLHTHEHGDFLAAGGAPSGPEVDYQYLPAPALERLGISLYIIQACG